MAYVIATLHAYKDEQGRVHGTVINAVVHEGNRPETAAEVGANPQVLALLSNRADMEVNEVYESTIRVGAGIAARVMNGNALAWPGQKSRVGKALERNFGPIDFSRGLFLANKRDGGAGGTQFCIDPAFGVGEGKDLLANMAKEAAEYGLYKPDGWARLVLPPEMAHVQHVLDEAQQVDWAHLAPGFPCRYEVHLHLADVAAADTINGLPGLLAVEEFSGSAEFGALLDAELTGEGWLIRDTEGREDKGEWSPLGRNPAVVGILERFNIPAIFQFGPNGFDEKALVVPIDGLVKEFCLNSKAKTALKLFDLL